MLQNLSHEKDPYSKRNLGNIIFYQTTGLRYGKNNFLSSLTVIFSTLQIVYFLYLNGSKKKTVSHKAMYVTLFIATIISEKKN